MTLRRAIVNVLSQERQRRPLALGAYPRAAKFIRPILAVIHRFMI